MDSIHQKKSVQPPNNPPSEIKISQRKPVLAVDGVFMGCKEENYLKKMQEKAEVLQIYSSARLTPKFYEQSPYKLHITIEGNDHQKHQENIKEIVITHLENGAINDFKLVDHVKIKTEIDSAANLLALLLENQHILKRNERPDPGSCEKLFSALDKYHHRKVQRLPYPDEIDEFIETLKTRISSAQRFLYADQFTIYVPETFDENKILNLCKDVNTYLTENNVPPGKSLDVASPIAKHISLRQDYLLEDFKAINDQGYIDLDKRIMAVESNENDNDRRRQVVIEQEQSHLYQYLRSGFQ